MLKRIASAALALIATGLFFSEIAGPAASGPGAIHVVCDSGCGAGGTSSVQGTGTAGSPAGGVLSVQGVAGGTALNIAPQTAAQGGDPCFGAAKSTADFESTSSGGSIITAVTAKKAYICFIRIHVSAATNISLIEGTGSSVCTGGTTAGVYLNTGVTAANGAAYAANGGDASGSGAGTIAQNATTNQNICVLFTTTNSPQVNVHVAYVMQ